MISSVLQTNHRLVLPAPHQLRVLHGSPWGFFWQPAPIPVRTRTRAYGCGFSQVQVRVWCVPVGLRGTHRLIGQTFRQTGQYWCEEMCINEVTIINNQCTSSTTTSRGAPQMMSSLSLSSLSCHHHLCHCCRAVVVIVIVDDTDVY